MATRDTARAALRALQLDPHEFSNDDLDAMVAVMDDAAKAAAPKEAEMSQEEREALGILNAGNEAEGMRPQSGWGHFRWESRSFAMGIRKRACELFGAEAAKLREELQSEKDRSAKLHVGYTAAGAEITQLREDLSHEKARCEAAENRARQEREQYDEERKERLRLATEVGLREKEIARLKAELAEARKAPVQQPPQERDPDEVAKLSPCETMEIIRSASLGRGIRVLEGVIERIADERIAKARVPPGSYVMGNVVVTPTVEMQSKSQPEAPVKVGDWVVVLNSSSMEAIDGKALALVTEVIDGEWLRPFWHSCRKVSDVDTVWRKATDAEREAGRVLP